MKKFKPMAISAVAAAMIISMGLGGCVNVNSGKTSSNSEKERGISDDYANFINKDGNNILTRYYPPEGYKRVPAEKGSFAYFLRHEKLKPFGSKVIYYNGKEKANKGKYDAVFDVDLKGKNLLHCADACMKFRADYLYSTDQLDRIRFTFVGGTESSFTDYLKGYRINPETGAKTKVSDDGNKDELYEKYMTQIYAYSGTPSLKNDTDPVNLDDIKIGDIFVRDGVPGTKRVGHAMIVVDMAENDKGEKVIMLAQSHMPAQQTQIAVNMNNRKLSPWYSLAEIKKEGKLKTPEWTFELNELQRFR